MGLLQSQITVFAHDLLFVLAIILEYDRCIYLIIPPSLPNVDARAPAYTCTHISADIHNLEVLNLNDFHQVWRDELRPLS